jgi:hypothetical protein
VSRRIPYHGSYRCLDPFQGLIVRKVFDKTLSELRIARAHIKLLCIPESESERRMVSLAWIGDYEVRMFEVRQVSSADAPLFWLELFDHTAQVAVDSCSCDEIEYAVAVLEYLVSQAKCSDESPPQAANEAQS